MSPRDLPVWARASAAGLVLLAGWHIPRTAELTTLVGHSALEVSAGVVAIAILLGMGLPLDLWPQHPQRDRFSMPAALAVAVVMGGLMIASGPTGLPEDMVSEERGLILTVMLGSVAWALAWGQLHHRMFFRWYGWAAAAAIVPVLIGIVTIAIQDGAFPAIRFGLAVRAGGFFLVVGSAVALVTQEMAFRRVLVGQAGDAGLATVILAGLLFGVWNAVAPDPVGGVWEAAVLGTLRGVVLGSLYSLSRSLLVPALCHGVWLASVRSLDRAAELAGGNQLFDDRMLPVIVATGLVALLLAYRVSRRSGFVGVLARRG